MDENINYIINEDLNINKNLNIDLLMNEINIFENTSEDILKNNNDLMFAMMNYYDVNYTIKELILVCEYYGIFSKKNKMKKQEIIELLLLFELEEENIDLVLKRKYLWSCMNELKMDKFMKKFILW